MPERFPAPGEWPFAALEISQNRILLHVIEVNAVQGQVNGISRTLDISAYSEETREAINRMVERSEQWALEGLTGRRKSDVTQLFYTMCSAHFPSMTFRYSLFSRGIPATASSAGDPPLERNPASLPPPILQGNHSIDGVFTQPGPEAENSPPVSEFA